MKLNLKHGNDVVINGYEYNITYFPALSAWSISVFEGNKLLAEINFDDEDFVKVKKLLSLHNIELIKE